MTQSPSSSPPLLRAHPGSLIAAKRWPNPWYAWALALRTRRSFGHALAFGALALGMQAVLGLGFAVLGRLLDFILFRGVADATVLIGSLTLPACYAAFVIYAASRFIDPEVRLWGGFGNLRFWRFLGVSIGMGAALVLVPIGLGVGGAGLLGQSFNIIFTPWNDSFWELRVWLLGAFVLLLAILIWQVLLLLALRVSLRWPLVRQQARTPLRTLSRHPKFYRTLLLLALSVWGAWALATFISVVVSVASIFILLFFIVIPFTVVLVSGYTILVFGAVAIAPFRVAGWTVSDNESMASVFE